MGFSFRLVHERTGSPFDLLRPKGLFGRAKGLMWAAPLQPNEGAYLARCSAIHMLGMKCPIDLVWLDENGLTAMTHEDVQPGFVVRRCRGAAAVVELPAGTVRRLGIAPGDAWLPKDRSSF